MSRFDLNETYTFIQVNFEPGENSYGPLYQPWQDKLLDIQVVNLTCSEHHKVGWNQDPKGEKEYDGFIFLDTDGNKWANQYPTASYGQLDDSADRHVRRYFKTEDLLLVDDKGEVVYEEQEQGKTSVKKPGTEDLWKVFDQQFFKPYVLATETLGSVYRAINPRERDGKLPDNYRDMLRGYLKTLIETVEAISNKKVVFEPLTFGEETEKETISDYMVARLA